MNNSKELNALSAAEIEKYLLNNPKFQEQYKVICNRHLYSIPSQDELNAMKGEMDTMLDELYKAGELPAQAVCSVSCEGDTAQVDWYWSASMPQPT